ncbi:hypothetical protein [Nodosilinea sp. P-1105]|uniref:hypothetical protein n=1 Tax=Nodosilinea sp. P-1105 TaxID=2546229 RepID=UPI00146F320D|nr:hypothetical protein [Nodosilinea sp. P-1105]NMF85525.1 hypothetical protein [Nodosilinea sp. P-1105]
MPSPRSSAAIAKYLLTLAAVVGAVLLAKLIITWAAEVFLYPIPILGGWLKSLEIIELTNILLFALLGFGIGGASRYLSAKTPLGMKSIALIVALPLVFFSSYWLRYQMWLGQLSAQAERPRQDIVAMANQALERESGSQGFWGYYRITTKMPILPATTAELERMAQDQQWFRSELTRFSGIEPGVFSMIFDGAGWGIRIFHMLLAAITGLIYFSKGLAWADGARLRRLAKGK